MGKKTPKTAIQQMLPLPAVIAEEPWAQAAGGSVAGTGP